MASSLDFKNRPNAANGVNRTLEPFQNDGSAWFYTLNMRHREGILTQIQRKVILKTLVPQNP
ncbi:MAG: hypothetical protein K1X66_02345 [Verrucomicrobiae bacterium]|nr:hypothetical protein [Verrucomicrobiae bacterium]